MVYPTLWRASVPTNWDAMFGRTTAAPAVDVREDADAIEVHAELPGIRPEDVQVNFENGVLTIAGEKKQEVSEKNEGDWHLVERQYGRFERRFTLPRTVDAQRIDARFRDGVLRVRLPKAEEAKPRRIEITVEGTKAI